MKNKTLFKSVALLGTLVTLGGTAVVTAEQWVAKTPDQIVIEQGATEYVMTWGDTIWAIGQKINVKTDVLLEANDLTYETARVIPVGRKIKLVKGEGDKLALEVTDKQGNVIGTRELKPEDKVDSTKDFGYDVETGKPTLKVTTDKDGNKTAVPNNNLTTPSKPTIKFQNGGGLTVEPKPSIDPKDIPAEPKGNGSETGSNDNVGSNDNGVDTGVSEGDNGFVFEPSEEPKDNGNVVVDPEHDVDPTENPSDNGSVDNGNVDNGSVDNGNTEVEPVNPPVDNGNTEVEPVNPPVDNGNVDSGTDNGNVDNGSVDNGNVDNGNTDNGTNDTWSVDNGNTEVEPVNPPVDNGNTETEPVNPPSDNGNVDNGSNDNGSVDNGNTETDPVTPPTTGVDIEAGNKGLWKRQMYIDAGATLGVITGDYAVDGDLGRYDSREDAKRNAEIVMNSRYNDDLAWDYEDGKTTFPPVNGWESGRDFGETTWKVIFR